MNFEFGTDFGLGGAAYVDGIFEIARTDDLWWAHNWGSGDVFVITKDFEAGLHTITIYGHEGCCDGGMDVRF